MVFWKLLPWSHFFKEKNCDLEKDNIQQQQ